MTDRIADAIRLVAARLHPSSDAVELRRLAAMVGRLEQWMDEIAANGLADAQAPREGNVVAFRSSPALPPQSRR